MDLKRRPYHRGVAREFVIGAPCHSGGAGSDRALWIGSVIFPDLLVASGPQAFDICAWSECCQEPLPISFSAGGVAGAWFDRHLLVHRRKQVEMLMMTDFLKGHGNWFETLTKKPKM